MAESARGSLGRSLLADSSERPEVQKGDSSLAVLISAFNAERYIVESVTSALSQTYQNTSVWVIDDGSTDRTWDLLSQIESPRLHRFSRRNRGKAASINELLERCGATYFAMQDADDLSDPERAAVVVKRLDEDPDLALVLSGYEAFIDGRRKYRISRSISTDEVARIIDSYSVPSHDATMAGRVDIARAIGFDSSFRIGQGIDFIWRVGERHRVLVVPEVLYRYRVHGESTTLSSTAELTYKSARVTAAAVSRRTGSTVTEEEVIKRFGIRHDVANNMYGTYALAVRTAIAEGDRSRAIRVGLHSAWRVRLGPRYLRPLLLALGGDRVADWRRARTTSSVPPEAEFFAKPGLRKRGSS
jgi:glycosyltransferase involved in cell wall biosynthesis